MRDVAKTPPPAWHPRLAHAITVPGRDRAVHRALDSCQNGRSGRAGQCRAASAVCRAIATAHLAQRGLAQGVWRLPAAAFALPEIAQRASAVLGCAYGW